MPVGISGLRKIKSAVFAALEVLAMGWFSRQLRDGTKLEYDQGKDDKWCVYVTEPGGYRNPPRDVDCFSQLKELRNCPKINC